MKLSIEKEFSNTPGSRYKSESAFSGEEFRENHLKPKFLKAIENKEKLEVDLDGVRGYATSFLEEAFGGLTREYGKEKVLNTITFISKDEPYLITDIHEYIESAKI